MFRLFAKFRFLPATIFVAVLMLTVRIGDIWDSVEGGLSVADAVAQQEGEGQQDEMQKDAGEDPAADDQDEDVERLIANDPTLLTQTEIDLLQQLAERRKVLQTRESEVEMREGLLQAAEARIEKKIAELRLYQETIEKLVKTYDDQQGAKIQSLVKIYENMKPKDAARIFEELEMDTLLLVTEGMSERKLAPIMAKMNPARATEITVELSKLRNLPNETLKAGG
ncbi:MAG TPA: hypothetical protein ENI69_04170 [Rhodospirillales bacterium]|nr:hypothetical protein [Rhodospirillales bacterium]